MAPKNGEAAMAVCPRFPVQGSPSFSPNALIFGAVHCSRVTEGQ